MLVRFALFYRISNAQFERISQRAIEPLAFRYFNSVNRYSLVIYRSDRTLLELSIVYHERIVRRNVDKIKLSCFVKIMIFIPHAVDVHIVYNLKVHYILVRVLERRKYIVRSIVRYAVLCSYADSVIRYHIRYVTRPVAFDLIISSPVRYPAFIDSPFVEIRFRKHFVPSELHFMLFEIPLYRIRVHLSASIIRHIYNPPIVVIVFLIPGISSSNAYLVASIV